MINFKDEIEQHKQQIKWSRIRDGVYWGVSPIGLAYSIERGAKVQGVQQWELKEFPNEDAEIGEYVDVGPLADLKRRAEGEATCHAINKSRESQACRECGCTDNNACAGGCYWVEKDLCSACAARAQPGAKGARRQSAAPRGGRQGRERRT